jgi:hypothetical protein
MSKPKAFTHYTESDVATLIDGYMINLETSEGIRFKSLHATPNTVVIKIGKQTFIISITDKLKAN